MSGNQYVFYLKCHTRLPSSGTTADLQVATAHRKSCWSLSQNLSEVIELLFLDLSALRFGPLEMAVSVLSGVLHRIKISVVGVREMSSALSPWVFYPSPYRAPVLNSHLANDSTYCLHSPGFHSVV